MAIPRWGTVGLCGVHSIRDMFNRSDFDQGLYKIRNDLQLSQYISPPSIRQLIPAFLY